MVQLILWTILHFSILVSANVEKLIFMGPSSSTSSLDLHGLSTLTPDQTTLRTQFHSKFNHTPIHPQAIPSEKWFLLSSLTSNRRYEVRICWPATQPTSFELDLFTEDELVQKQDLLQSLQKSQNLLGRTIIPSHEVKRKDSRLLLRVKATADYYTMNQTLMSKGLIVNTDIILDEYIWNLVPRSLIYTGLYILATTIVAVFIARNILSYLEDVASVDRRKEVKDKKRS